MIAQAHSTRSSRFARILAGLGIAGVIAVASGCSSADGDEVNGNSEDALQLGQKPGDKGPPPAPTTTTPTPSPKTPAPPSNAGDWQSFVGAWSGGNGLVSEIVFENTALGAGHALFAHVNALGGGRVDGIFVVTKDFLDIDVKVPDYSGQFRYTFLDKDLLQLNDVANPTKAPITLKREPSYCDALVDCNGQGISHDSCKGGFLCAKNNTCQWLCILPEPLGEKCGDTTCGMGEVCCNSSCGICTKKGDSCTQQICPVKK